MDVAVPMQVLLGVTINACHAFVVVNIGLHMIVMLPMQFPLLPSAARPGCPIAVTFHGADITNTGTTTTVVAMDTLGFRNL